MLILVRKHGPNRIVTTKTNILTLKSSFEVLKDNVNIIENVTSSCADNVGNTGKEEDQVLDESGDEFEYVDNETPHVMISGGANDASLRTDEDYDLYETYYLEGLTTKQWALYEAVDINHRGQFRC